MIKNKTIDNYLNESKQPVNEASFLAVLTAFAAFRFIICIYGFIQLYLYAVEVRKASKLDLDLSKKINKIMGRTDLEVFIIPDDTVNAFNMNGKTLYLCRGLQKILLEREILAILIHEASHGLDKDGVKQTLLTELTSIIPSAAAITTILSIVALFPISLFFIYISLKIIYGLSGNYWSRRDEYKSDKTAIEKGYGEELSSAFKKMLKIMKQPQVKPDQSFLGKLLDKVFTLFSTHPDIYERIEIAMKNKDLYKKAEGVGIWQAVLHACEIVKIDSIKFAEEHKPLRDFLVKIKTGFKPHLQEIE
jgi:Zn-dependent protease with chaperone function